MEIDKVIGVVKSSELFKIDLIVWKYGKKKHHNTNSCSLK